MMLDMYFCIFITSLVRISEGVVLYVLHFVCIYVCM